MRRASLAALFLAATLLPSAPPATAARAPLVPAPAYYRPAIVDGFAYPLARSNFLSVLEMDDNWHDPRLRLINGKWLQVGIHEGIDIIAEKGTPILAALGGTVENVGWTFYSGERIGIRGTDGRYYLYCHISAEADGITPGAHVSTGQLIGRVGNTGYGPPGTEDQFIPHLHFGIEGPGGWENPWPMLVRTYGSALAFARDGEIRLAALAKSNDRAGWSAEAEALYTTFGIPLP